MKTHVHFAIENALKRVGMTMDQMDGHFRKCQGWSWLVLQGKKNSPNILPLLPAIYKMIYREHKIIALDMIREIFGDKNINNGNMEDSYLEGFHSATSYLLKKMKERKYGASRIPEAL
jgi:hypothetical protein